MTGAARVVAFAVALAFVFGAAAALGRAVGPLEREVEAEHSADATDGTHGEAADEPVGLSLSANGFRLAPERVTFAPRRPHVFAFRVRGAARYDVVHERRMHLIVVRRDLAHFQHLHPVYRNGVWSTPLTFPAPGTYRVFADFSAGGKRTVLGHDVFVPGAWRPESLRPARRAPSVDGYVVSPRGVDTIAFRVSRNGVEVRPEPYLGARGHLVVLRAGDLAYIHAHPETDELAFDVNLPSHGAFRLFVQFKHGGRVRTVSFPIGERAP